MMFTNPNAFPANFSPSTSSKLSKSSLIVEDIATNCKPLIKHFSMEKRGHSSFPKLNLDSTFPLLSPFLSFEEAMLVWKKKSERENNEKASNSSRPQLKKEGWCECCSVKYDDLEQHVKTVKHVDYAMDDRNYAAIDNFISELNGPKSDT